MPASLCATPEDLLLRLSAEPFGEAPSLSVDHAVWSTPAARQSCRSTWRGATSVRGRRLRDIATADGDGNVLHGDVLAST